MTPETTPEWTSYYEAVDGREPRELLIEALDALGPLPSADLVHAAWSLPFCPPRLVSEAVGLDRGRAAPRRGVRRATLRDRDSWAAEPDMTFHTEAQARAVLSPLETLVFREEENDGEDALGNAKHRHAFHVIARSPAGPAS